MNPVPYQSNYVRPFNNDRMGMLSAFRAPAPAPAQRPRAAEMVSVPSASLNAGMAAPALPKANPPRPTQLDDAQAENALAEVQQNANDMAAAHSNLDADRVARLLGLLS